MINRVIFFYFFTSLNKFINFRFIAISKIDKVGNFIQFLNGFNKLRKNKKWPIQSTETQFYEMLIFKKLSLWNQIKINPHIESGKKKQYK